MEKKIDIEKVIESGTFQERMENLSHYYALRNSAVKKAPPFSAALAEKLRKAVIQDLREGNYEREGLFFQKREPLSAEEQKQAVEYFLRWEILIELATDYSTNIQATVERYTRDIYSLKALLEQYQALSAIQALANALLQEGVKPEDMEQKLLEGLQFAEDHTPYELKRGSDGKIRAYLVEHETHETGGRSYVGIDFLEKEIKRLASANKKQLAGFKVAAEAFLHYADLIGYRTFITGSHIFIVNYSKMVTAPITAEINTAYLEGWSTEKVKSPFPALIADYKGLKISPKEQATNNNFIAKAVERVWNERKRSIANSLR